MPTGCMQLCFRKEVPGVLTVLIVDKEQDARDWILHLIDWDKLNAQVVGTCSNGVEALESILLCARMWFLPRSVWTARTVST